MVNIIKNFWQAENRYKNLITLFPVIFLLLAIREGWPYDFFTLLRVVVFGSAVYLSWLAFTSKKNAWSWALGFIALVFNPLSPLHFSRNLWLKIDIIVAIFLLISIFIFNLNKFQDE